MEIILIPVMLFGLVVFTVVPFWRIFSKAGYSGALSLLMVFPVLNVVMLYYLAFAQWPVQKRQTMLEAEKHG